MSRRAGGGRIAGSSKHECALSDALETFAEADVGREIGIIRVRPPHTVFGARGPQAPRFDVCTPNAPYHVVSTRRKRCNLFRFTRTRIRIVTSRGHRVPRSRTRRIARSPLVPGRFARRRAADHWCRSSRAHDLTEYRGDVP